jgi:20S proteasome subunit beta 2
MRVLTLLLICSAVLLSSGTTIVGICCKDGVVLGADTRATGGDIVMDKNKLKIHQISPQLFCCAAGTAADCEQATRSMRHLISMTGIESTLSGESGNLASSFLIKSKIIDMFGGGQGRRPIESSIILGGFDNDGPSLHQISQSGVQQVSCCASGSGQIDALSSLESRRKVWGDPIENHLGGAISTGDGDGDGYSRALCENVSVDDAVVVVREAVASGVFNDLGSGSFVDICVIRGPGQVRLWRENALTGEVIKVTIPAARDEDEDEDEVRGALRRFWAPSSGRRSIKITLI